MDSILQKYVTKKANGKWSTVHSGATIGGTYTVFKKVYDEDGNLLPDLQVMIGPFTAADLTQRLADIQNEKQGINAFIAAESVQ